jgi:ABC-type nickel/cobalt efflux system permease component RcnA
MEDLKIAVTNLFALGISVREANPYLQTVSLVLAIGYTIISITKKLKDNGKD